MKNFDALTALEKWTEENMAPDCLVGKAEKRYLDQNTETAILSISEGNNLYWWR
jgi:tannase and feruloyl esterase